MNNRELFGMALGVSDPYFIKEIEFKSNDSNTEKELHIYIDFYRSSKFKSSDGKNYTAYDTRQRKWRHLDFFQHVCYLHCGVPRVKNAVGKVEQIEVPWARAGSGFSLLFESFVLQLIKFEMPVNKIAKTVRENPDRMWTIFNFYVKFAYKNKDHSKVRKLGIDETSTKKGHQYITTAVDMESREVVHVVEGKGKKSIDSIKTYLESKDCAANQIKEVSLDMSAAFIAGSLESFPEAALTFDKFHVKQLLNKAMDKVRKIERKNNEYLKGHKYTFLKNKENLNEKRRKELEILLKSYPVLGESYRLKILFDDLWDITNIEDAELFLDDWCNQVNNSKIYPFMDFVKTVKRHKYGILSYAVTRLTNGILEGLNSKIQLAKRRARGYSNTDNFINMIYLITGNLNLNYPHKTL